MTPPPILNEPLALAINLAAAFVCGVLCVAAVKLLLALAAWCGLWPTLLGWALASVVLLAPKPVAPTPKPEPPGAR